MANVTFNPPEPAPPQVVLELTAAEAAVVHAFIGQFNSGTNCEQVAQRGPYASRLIDLPTTKNEIKVLSSGVWTALNGAFERAGRVGKGR